MLVHDLLIEPWHLDSTHQLLRHPCRTMYCITVQHKNITVFMLHMHSKLIFIMSICGYTFKCWHANYITTDNWINGNVFFLNTFKTLFLFIFWSPTTFSLNHFYTCVLKQVNMNIPNVVLASPPVMAETERWLGFSNSSSRVSHKGRTSRFLAEESLFLPALWSN